MRVRLLGHYVHVSIAAMAAVDAVVFFCAMLLAYRTRFHTWYPVPSIGSEEALWLCAAVFTAMSLVSVLGFGLYSSRQRARTGGVFVRLIAACAAATAATALLFYFIPSLYIGRGVLGLALLFSLLGVGAAHGVFSRMMDESLLKRRVLVYGVGQRTTAISGLRRRSSMATTISCTSRRVHSCRMPAEASSTRSAGTAIPSPSGCTYPTISNPRRSERRRNPEIALVR